MASEPVPVLRVTAKDLKYPSDAETIEVAEGNYVLLCTEPCHVSYINRSANGTVQIILKDYKGPIRP